MLAPALASLLTAAAAEPPYAVVLGVAQDAGHPQAGCTRSCCARAFADPGAGHRVASLGLVDPATGQRWLIDATPDLPLQLRALHDAAPAAARLDGVLLTHAHVGHYLGLAHLGREAMGADGVDVWAMPRMRSFLEGNGPWDQLVSLDNIELHTLSAGTPVRLSDRLEITPLAVPHRDEYSETVGYLVEGPSRTLLWLPDIDKWAAWLRPVEEVLAEVDVAYVDGTFYADGEVSRPMSEIPHPFVVETMERLAPLPASERSKVRFVHLNHTNPALDPSSAAGRAVSAGGFHLAVEGEKTPL